MSCLGRLASKVMKDEKFFTTIGSYFWPSIIIIMGCHLLWEHDMKGYQNDFFFNQVGESAKSEVNHPFPLHHQQAPSALSRNTEVTRNNGFVLSFNQKADQPNWAYWKLTASHVIASKYHHQFVGMRSDVSEGDDGQSGKEYEEIQLCPSTDNEWSASALMDTYRKSNYCRMHKDVILRWKELEEHCRAWAVEHGEIYIYAGCIIDDTATGTSSDQTIPVAFFKTIVRLGGHPSGIGFIFPNYEGSPKMSPRSIAEIENICGRTFYDGLSDSTLPAIKKTADLAEWQTMPETN